MDLMPSSFTGHSVLLSVVFIFMISETQSALLCSQCTSGPDGLCVTSPPPATKCLNSNSKLVNCMTTRQFDYNGTLISFSRGCTMVRVGEGCMEQNDNTTLCYVTCHQDNCNYARTVTFWVTTLIITLAFHFVVLDITDFICT